MAHVFALRPDPADVRVARELCVQTLSAEVAASDPTSELIDDAAVITSELVTNSIQAGAARIRLHLDRDGDRFRIAVDDDAAGDVTQRTPGTLHAGGRGLMIVAALAEDWGVDRSPSGKTVWADLNLREPDQQAADDPVAARVGHTVPPAIRPIEETEAMSDSAAEQQPILAMTGDLDIATELEWRRRGDELLAAHPDLRDVVVDLSRVGFLDSRGMAVLIHLHGEARDRGGKLTLRAVPPRIVRALNVAGLDQVFVVEPD